MDEPEPEAAHVQDALDEARSLLTPDWAAFVNRVSSIDRAGSIDLLAMVATLALHKVSWLDVLPSNPPPASTKRVAPTLLGASVYMSEHSDTYRTVLDLASVVDVHGHGQVTWSWTTALTRTLARTGTRLASSRQTRALVAKWTHRVDASRFDAPGTAQTGVRVVGLTTRMGNALRRTLVGHVPLVVLRPERCTVRENQSVIDNEVLTHRLQQVPVMLRLQDGDPVLAPGQLGSCEVRDPTQLYVQLKVECEPNRTRNVTTADLELGHINHDLLPKHVSQAVFGYEPEVLTQFLVPAHNPPTTKRRLDLTCVLSTGTHSEHGAYASGAHTAYPTPRLKVDAELAAEVAKWTAAGCDAQEVRVRTHDWTMTEAKRLVVPMSYDFVVESNCVYSNEALLLEACRTLIRQFRSVVIDPNAFEVHMHSDNECFVVLTTLDESVGSVLVELMERYHLSDVANTGLRKMTMMSCGREATHYTDSNKQDRQNKLSIRLMYEEPVAPDQVRDDVVSMAALAKTLYEKLMGPLQALVDDGHARKRRSVTALLSASDAPPPPPAKRPPPSSNTKKT